MELLLMISGQYRWFAWNEPKGWTVMLGLGVLTAIPSYLAIFGLYAKINRRKFQVDLAALLFLVVLVAFVCVWVGRELRHAWRQQEIVRRLRQPGSGGSVVMYDYLLDPAAADRYLGKEWHIRPELRQVLGDDFFQDVLAVKVHSDDGLRTACELATLRFLDCEGIDVTDLGLRSVSYVPQLQGLYVENSPSVTDRGVAEIEKLSQLRQLRLARVSLTDEGLAPLLRLRQLETLDLQGTRVTDQGLLRLAELPRLKSLVVTGAPVTPAGIARFRALAPHCAVVSGE